LIVVGVFVIRKFCVKRRIKAAERLQAEERRRQVAAQDALAEVVGMAWGQMDGGKAKEGEDEEVERRREPFPEEDEKEQNGEENSLDIKARSE